MASWKYMTNIQNPEQIDPVIGDRGMTNLDAAIFTEVMIRMFDEAKSGMMELPFSQMEKAMEKHDRNETIAWNNANRCVNR